MESAREAVAGTEWGRRKKNVVGVNALGGTMGSAITLQLFAPFEIFSRFLRAMSIAVGPSVSDLEAWFSWGMEAVEFDLFDKSRERFVPF